MKTVETTYKLVLKKTLGQEPNVIEKGRTLEVYKKELRSFKRNGISYCFGHGVYEYARLEDFKVYEVTTVTTKNTTTKRVSLECALA